jgi:hypothetical protein
MSAKIKAPAKNHFSGRVNLLLITSTDVTPVSAIGTAFHIRNIPVKRLFVNGNVRRAELF